MGSTPSRLREFARRLLAYDVEAGGAAGSKSEGKFRLFEKLREPFVQLSGLGGYCSLVSRSLVLASIDVASLRALHACSDGSLAGLEELERQLSAEEMAAAEIALTAHMVALLVTFIGPTLTLQLLRDIWPEMEDLTF